MPIIHSGAAMVAHRNRGTSSYLLVTFLGAFHEHEAETHYLLRSVVERENISCVGISARLRNLYISDEMQEVARLIREIREPGQALIVLGQSSGGYAALKFAGLLGADQVLAFSPIFSMDEDDLGITENMNYERTILRGAIRFHRVPPEIIRPGMRPGPEDCPVVPLVVYDVGNENDSYAAARLAAVMPEAEFLRVRHLGHAVLNRIQEYQGQLLPALLTSLEQGDRDAVKRQLGRLVRNNEDAIGELLARIARWRPHLVPRLLGSPRVAANFKDPNRRRVLNNVVAYALAARGDVRAAAKQLGTLYPDLFPDREPGRAAAADAPLLVLSFHGQVLCYDNERGEVVFASASLIAPGSTVPVQLHAGGAEPRLVIQTRTGEEPVVVDRRGGADGFEIVPVPDTGLVALRRNAAFLRTDGNAPPVFAADAPMEWERFALVPIPHVEAFRDRAGLSWFDQASFRLRADGDTPAASPPASRKTAFRSVLQRFFSG